MRIWTYILVDSSCDSRLDDTQKENDENQEKSAIGEAESKQLHDRIDQAEDRAAIVRLL